MKYLRIPHRATFYYLLWLKQGNITHTVDFHRIDLSEDALLFVRKDAVQFFDQKHPFSAQILLFTESFFCRSPLDKKLLQDSGLFNNLRTPVHATMVKMDKDLKIIWDLMRKEFLSVPSIGQSEVLKNYLSNIILLAQRKAFSTEPKASITNPANKLTLSFHQLLDDHFSQQHNVAFYAKQLQVTEKLLSQVTQNITGLTAKAAINNRIVLEAKRLLTYSDLSSKNISFELGFEEPTNFIKFFKKLVGSTPTAFRTSILK